MSSFTRIPKWKLMRLPQTVLEYMYCEMPVNKNVEREMGMYPTGSLAPTFEMSDVEPKALNEHMHNCINDKSYLATQDFNIRLMLWAHEEYVENKKGVAKGERRARRLAEKWLGKELKQKLIKLGFINVRGSDGRIYRLTGCGLFSKKWENICVEFAGEEQILKWDRILMTYFGVKFGVHDIVNEYGALENAHLLFEAGAKEAEHREESIENVIRSCMRNE